MSNNASASQYFLSSRNLPWYSVAISTIATNIQGYQLLGMMGSAYIFGLAQANLEINAVQGILISAFIFVPLYLKEKVYTVTEFIENRLGKNIALFYSIANISLFSTITLGAALFWGAYATEIVFDDFLEPFVPNKFERIVVPFSDGVKSLNVVTDLKQAYQTKGKSLINDFERNITLAIIDNSWKDHLRKMDELKQSVMEAKYPKKKYPFIRFFLGDIRDLDRLSFASRDIENIIHAAALEQVPAAEYNPCLLYTSDAADE